MLLIGPLLRPLARRSGRQRQLMGELSNTASDIVGGLRVLRGIGGEQVFHDRYVRESQQTRRAGVQVARLQSMLDALQVLLPGVFVVIVVWLGARYAVQGRITPGDLVAFYGYSAFLMIPLRTATEYANKLIRARVAAGRVCRVLALTSDHRDPVDPVDPPPPGAELADARTGLRVRPGVLTALVSDEPDETAALADRLGLCAAEVDGQVDDAVTLGGVPLTRLRRDDVRRRIVVSDTGAALFSGRLGDVLDASFRGPLASESAPREARSPSGSAGWLAGGDVPRAMATASTDDILAALPDGLDTVVAERGRTFSGGQRQRLVLARALAGDPEILVLVEPTSAVDAHTEARIAARLRRHREGRTTIVVTSSPLVLDAVDEVAFLRGGRVVATGTHRDLLESDAGYRAVVTREQEPAVVSS